MKFDKSILLKNLTGIFCGALILCTLLPFVTFGTSSGGVSAESPAFNGIDILTDGGFVGILYFLMPILILLACYLPPLGAFKKYICLGASVIGTALLFIIPGQMAYGASAGQGIAESAGAKVDVDISYQIGFWLMLVFLIALVALSVIQFFNLKGNKVFEAVKASDNTASGQGMTMPHIDTEKITGFAQNVAGTVSGQIKNITANRTNQSGSSENPQTVVSQTPAVSQNVLQNPPASSVSQSVQKPQAQPVIQTVSTPVSPAPAMQSEEKKKPEEVMELLKKLFEMKEAGILTDDEFTAKKQEMLKKM